MTYRTTLTIFTIFVVSKSIILRFLIFSTSKSVKICNRSLLPYQQLSLSLVYYTAISPSFCLKSVKICNFLSSLINDIFRCRWFIIQAKCHRLSSTNVIICNDRRATFYTSNSSSCTQLNRNDPRLPCTGAVVHNFIVSICIEILYHVLRTTYTGLL